MNLFRRRDHLSIVATGRWRGRFGRDSDTEIHQLRGRFGKITRRYERHATRRGSWLLRSTVIVFAIAASVLLAATFLRPWLPDGVLTSTAVSPADCAPHCPKVIVIPVILP